MPWRSFRRPRSRPTQDARLDAELRDHIERHAADAVRAGAREADARREAMIVFGGLESIKEQCRDAHPARWLADVVQDVRYGGRVLVKSRTFTLVTVLSLAFGIGANVAIFSLVDAVLLKSLPVRAPHELVLVSETQADRDTFAQTTGVFGALSGSDALAGLCAFRGFPSFRIAGKAGVELAAGQLVSGNCFDLLGVRAEMGRLLSEDDDRAGAPAAAVVSYAFWQERLDGDPHVVGRSITIQGQPVTIVGVTARNFYGLEPGRAIEVTVPLTMQAVIMPGRLRNSPTARWLRLLGRLAPGVDLQRAETDLRRRWQATVAGEPRPPAVRRELKLRPGAQGLNDLRREFSMPLQVLMASVGVLLLVACANVASLLLARGRAREPEIGLRLALGAGRLRIVRQLFTEALMLALLGGVLGLALAWAANHAIVELLSKGRTPIVLELAPDLRLLAFTVATSVVTAILFGMSPALRSTRRGLAQPLGGAHARVVGATSDRRTRPGVLIALQTALSLVLLATAALFARSLINLQDFDAGFRRDRVLLVGVRPAVGEYDGPRTARLYRDLYDRFTSLPGVLSVTLAMDTPVGGLSWSASFVPVGMPTSGEPPQVHYNFVGPRFFETMAIPIRSGRDVRATDDERAPAIVVVSESVAHRLFPGRDAIGARATIGSDVVEVVGVAGDVRYTSLRQDTELVVYRPYPQQAESLQQALTFAIRSDVPPTSVTEQVRRAVRAVDPNLLVMSSKTLDAQFDASVVNERLLATISSFFGVMALVLVAIGVYGTLAYAVSQRARELGVRVALGATRGDIVRLLLTAALVPVSLGVLVGLPLALAASGVVESTLFGIAARDGATYGGSIVALLLVAAAAGSLPAWHAARRDPLAALRTI